MARSEGNAVQVSSPHPPGGTDMERRDEHSEIDAPDAIADPIADPGVEEHIPRLTDVDERAAKRVERQVALMLTLSAVASLAFVVCYFAVPHDAAWFGLGALNLSLGVTLGMGLLLIGLAAIQWAKKLMADREVVEERHLVGTPEEEKAEVLGMLDEGAEESQFGRRPLIRRSLVASLGLLIIPPVILLKDLGPLPKDALSHTIWHRGIRIVNDVTLRPLKLSDLHLGQIVNAVPENLDELEGTHQINAKAKAAVILVRMLPRDIKALPERTNWSVDGVMCYSKICTHVGCPINLYEQQTHKLLCPCHQSTFDLADNGKVLFGPAARPLPQLPIMVDGEGYLVAQSDFTEAVGPSFWERG
jgi:quinol---cytochrome c reductase iron-sulfur subunit